MIDKARIQQFTDDLNDAVAMEERFTLLDVEIVAALRDIARGVAERDPYVEFDDRDRCFCQWCFESSDAAHAGDCEWLNARELLGRASERSEEE